jgi:hypothetical protein
MDNGNRYGKNHYAFNKTPPGTTTTEYHKTKRIRTKGRIIFLQIKLPKWQIQTRLPTKAKENAIGIGKSNCQNGKSNCQLNEVKKKHHLFANQIVQMANPNQVANKGKGKSNCQLKQKE